MRPTDDSVREFVDGITHPIRRRDAETLLELMTRATGERPRMWGTIVGFGSYHYRYASGREGDAPAAGFSPRTSASTIYLPDGVDAQRELLGRLGAHSTGKGCLYLKNLDDVDLAALASIVTESYRAACSGTLAAGSADSGSIDRSE